MKKLLFILFFCSMGLYAGEKHLTITGQVIAVLAYTKEEHGMLFESWKAVGFKIKEKEEPIYVAVLHSAQYKHRNRKTDPFGNLALGTLVLGENKNYVMTKNNPFGSDSTKDKMPESLANHLGLNVHINQAFPRVIPVKIDNMNHVIPYETNKFMNINFSTRRFDELFEHTKDHSYDYFTFTQLVKKYSTLGLGGLVVILLCYIYKTRP